MWEGGGLGGRNFGCVGFVCGCGGCGGCVG